MNQQPTGNYFVAAYPPFSVWTAANTIQFRSALAASPGTDDRPPFGLYLHVPFCVERCRYCYYLSHGGRGSEAGRYVKALQGELDLLAASPALHGREVGFIYIGGGTPSSLSTADLQRLLSGVEKRFRRVDRCEITVECAPKTLTLQKVRALAASHVTRISLGVQQMDDHVLRVSGRVHLKDDIYGAWSLLRAAGFSHVNIDLLVGLPGESDASFFGSLEEVILMGPESVTIYQLEIPHNTPLYRSLQVGTGPTTSKTPLPEMPAPWSVKRARLAAAFARLESAGYSVRSAYTATRDPARHRFIYQEAQYGGADLVGAGPSAFSYVAGVHHQNDVSLDRYMERIESGELPVGRAHQLSDEERLVREFILQLKLGHVERARFTDRFGIDPAAYFAAPLCQMQQQGWLKVTEEAVLLTRAGLLRVDSMLPAFYLPKHRGLRYT